MRTEEFRDFPILEIASRLGIELRQSTLDRVEVQAKCPFCHDKRYRMYLNTVQNCFFCHNCSTGGNSISLYAKAFRISNSEAYSALSGLLDLGQVPPARPESVKEQPEAPLEDRHRVYLALLQELSLFPEHRENLRGRGLLDEIITGNLYRSIPKDARIRQHIAGELSKRFPLLGIPGFYTQHGAWTFSGFRGFLIPVCTPENIIQGFQIRLDQAVRKQKYVWFSSASRENGTGTHRYPHITGDTKSRTLFLTEGGLKADAASFLTGGELFVGLPGVGAVEHLPEVLKALKPERVVECVDMDSRHNEEVKKGLLKIEAVCREYVPRFYSFYWPERWKGIDEYLLYARQNGISINAQQLQEK